jgi:MinD superfamily P-loop ATPase
MKIAVASGKGGTGKTTLSVNLAAFIAQNSRVVLSDLDVEEPNSGLFLEIEQIYREEKFKMVPEWEEEDCTLCGICQEVCNFNAVVKLDQMVMLLPQLCHGCFACSELCPTGALPMIPQKMGILTHSKVSPNFDFVESRLFIGEEQAVPLIRQTHEYLDANFKVDSIKILDSPPGTSCPVIEVTREADFVILVTEPTPFGLHDLKLAVETMRILEKPFGVVVNRDGIGNEKVMDYCHDEGLMVMAKIPNDRKIAELYASGKLIYPEVPTFREMLEKIIGDIMNIATAKAS